MTSQRHGASHHPFFKFGPRPIRDPGSYQKSALAVSSQSKNIKGEDVQDPHSKNYPAERLCGCMFSAFRGLVPGLRPSEGSGKLGIARYFSNPSRYSVPLALSPTHRRNPPTSSCLCSYLLLCFLACLLALFGSLPTTLFLYTRAAPTARHVPRHVLGPLAHTPWSRPIRLRRSRTRITSPPRSAGLALHQGPGSR